jgi:hypothetical protein
MIAARMNSGARVDAAGKLFGFVIALFQGVFQLADQLAAEITQLRFFPLQPGQRTTQLHCLDTESGGQQTGTNTLRRSGGQSGGEVL